MYKVIDYGALNSDLLRAFFRSSPANTAVLIDMMGIESLKRDSLANHRQSFAVLAEYSERAVVMLPTGEVFRLRPDLQKFPRNLVDVEATKKFPQYCAATLTNDNTRILDAIAAKQAKARGFAESLLAQIAQFRELISVTRDGLSPALLADLRSGRSSITDPAYLSQICVNIRRIAVGMYAAAFPKDPEPAPDLLPCWFPFRVTVALYAIALKWAVDGGYTGAKPETLRNDAIDMIYVAFGTIFDGVITKDAKLAQIDKFAASIIRDGFGIRRNDAKDGP